MNYLNAAVCIFFLFVYFEYVADAYKKRREGFQNCSVNFFGIMPNVRSALINAGRVLSRIALDI